MRSKGPPFGALAVLFNIMCIIAKKSVIGW